jgi:hypothetical protein
MVRGEKCESARPATLAPWKRPNPGPCGGYEQQHPAERMRLLRARPHNGLRPLRVTLHDTEIDCLVQKGFLKSERRHDHAAIQSAIDGFICHALGPEQDHTAYYHLAIY